MNRGSGTVIELATEPRTRFNEAPIHESGKSQMGRGSHRSEERFNEAPIHESGK